MKYIVCKLFHKSYHIIEKFIGYTGCDTMIKCEKCGCEWQKLID